MPRKARTSSFFARPTRHIDQHRVWDTVILWTRIHRDELMADWELAVKGQAPYKIDPLK
jgi:hypothetical protein